MQDEKKISDGKLLYDPMFDNKAVLDWQDSEKGGIFGKAIFKKIIFMVILLAAIAAAMFFSFSTLSKSRYEFDPLDDGTYMLSAFNGQKNDYVLNIDYVRGEDGKADTAKVVSSVRKFTTSGNDSLCFVYIGKDVREIEETSFFYCTSLCAFFVDGENENYTSIDGILYKTENGIPTEVMICPQQYTRFKTALAAGEKLPADEAEAFALGKKLTDEKFVAELDALTDDDSSTAGKTVILPESVTKLGQLCFAYCEKLKEVVIPDGVKEIETMAFFKCYSLEKAELPNGIEKIGSDAFTKCSSLKYIFIPASVRVIGHHAFSECKEAEKVYMEAADTDGMELGEKWVPQYRKTFLKNRDIVFGAERGVK